MRRVKFFLSSSSLCTICQFSDKELFTVVQLLTGIQLRHLPDLFNTAHWPNCKFLKGTFTFLAHKEYYEMETVSPLLAKNKRKKSTL